MATIKVPAGQDAKVTQLRTPAQRKAEKLAAIPQEQLLCRATGRHRFPGDELDPSRTQDLPRGMTARMIKGGYQIIEECERGCGKVRTYTTRSGALWDVDTTYAYNHPADWVVISVDEREALDIHGSTDFKAEKHRRQAQLIIAAARKARAVEKAEAAREQAAARFSNGA